MNPRLTDIPLHADPVRESGLSIGYFQPADSFGVRWFHFLIGVCVGMGLATLMIVTLFGSRL